MTEQFKILFSPIKLGSMTAPNRIMAPAHLPGIVDLNTTLLEQDNLPGERLIAYWESKAKGGVGIVCTGAMGIHPSAVMFPFRNPDVVLQKLKKAADAVRRHGSCFVVQLWHAGGAIYSPQVGNQTWSASAMPPLYAMGGLPPAHAMTKDEIKEVIEGYAKAAILAKKAGASGVELHGAHGYLLTQFMSPATNKRTDEYGGAMEQRLRFALEVIDAVRDAIGSDFPIGMRIDGDQFAAAGFNLDDMQVMAPILTNSGKLNWLNVCRGGGSIAPMYYPTGYSVYLASAIKQVVDVPVCGGGRVNDPVYCERILEEGHVDIITMNRQLICDPEFPRKAREGRVDEIRKCLADSEGCAQRFFQERNPLGISCSYNPTVGKEAFPGWLELIPAPTKKKVMVIGGGPAGLETARVAAARGHRVSLWEKGDDLGGTVLVAAKAPGREDLGELPRYYRYQMKLLGVDVHLGTEVTAGTVKKENPDVVVVATGSLPFVPYDIKGIEQENVVKSVRDVLSGKARVGQNVVIADVQTQTEGLTTADFLVQQGKTVEVIMPHLAPGPGMEIGTLRALLQRLRLAGVKLTPHTELKEIAGNTVKVADTLTDEERLIEGVDTVILSYGGVCNDSLYYALQGQVKELYTVGDCKMVRKIVWATNDGATLARMI